VNVTSRARAIRRRVDQPCPVRRITRHRTGARCVTVTRAQLHWPSRKVVSRGGGAHLSPRRVPALSPQRGRSWARSVRGCTEADS